MLTLLSPAKSLDFESKLSFADYTTPLFLDQASVLVSQLQKLEPQAIASLMKLSDKLALLNYERFQDFTTPFNPQNARPALMAFTGDVYQGLQAQDFNADERQFAQNHLRILSGLYGVLKPLDLIQAYRLEMGSRFKNASGKDLYAFWGDKIRVALEAELSQHTVSTLINLASNEYFKVVQEQKWQHPVITPQFKDLKNGQYQTISFFAKKARGMMSRFMVKQKIDQPEGLKDFDLAGYYFDQKSSTQTEWLFLRDQPQEP